MFDAIAPAYTSTTLVDSLRVRWVLCSPTTFVLRTSKGEGPSPWGVFPVWTALPSSDYYAPSATPLRHRDFVRGLPRASAFETGEGFPVR